MTDHHLTTSQIDEYRRVAREIGRTVGTYGNRAKRMGIVRARDAP